MTAIHDFATAYSNAFQSGDVQQVMSLVTEDFVALPPDKPALVGRQAVAQQIAMDLSTMDVQQLEFKHEEVQMHGDWAFAWGNSRGAVLVGGETIDVTGKYLWVLQKQTDGSWKLARDSSNGE